MLNSANQPLAGHKSSEDARVRLRWRPNLPRRPNYAAPNDVNRTCSETRDGEPLGVFNASYAAIYGVNDNWRDRPFLFSPAERVRFLPLAFTRVDE
jgi:hypothetical protein